jgi:MFS transporter, DHA2 family, methylenomycin A resistance protein
MAQPVGKFVMVALALGTVLVSLDASAMNVALPSVQREFDATSANLQLIVVAYMIAMASCTLPIGAISDRVGRKPIYITGLIGFILGSALCGFSWNIEILIAARVVQGFGAATIFGLALAILTDSSDRASVPKIVAMWTTVSIVATSAGPFVGGLLVTTFGWRSVFFINIPLTIFVMIVSMVALKDDRKVQTKRLKLTGGVLIALTLSCFTWAIMQMQQFGFTSSKALLPLLLAILILAVLVFEQRHTDDPLVQWGSLKRSPIAACLGLSLVLALALSGSLYQMSIFTQSVLGFSPVLAGTVTLATSAAMAVLAPLVPKLLKVFGAALPFMVAILVAAIGMYLLGQLNPSSTLTWVIMGLLILGVGLGIADPVLSAISMQSSSGSDSGAVSGSLGLVSQVGGILGITVMGGLTTSVAVSTWSNSGGDSSLDALVGVGDISGVAAQAGQAARDLAATSYSSGVSITFIVGAVLLAIAGVLALALLPKKPLDSDVEVSTTLPMPR